MGKGGKRLCQERGRKGLISAAEDFGLTRKESDAFLHF
jgi:hypothetical protein